jgi:tripartite-type tricarboxylate transporter receptor subunit TctC
LDTRRARLTKVVKVAHILEQKSMKNMKFASIVILAASSGVCAVVVHAQAYPSRPVRIATTPSGGGNDFVARMLAVPLGAALGQTVIVDNRPSRIVGGLGARASADGYTLTLGGGTLQFSPLLEEMDYNILKDFAPIAQLERSPLVVVVNPSLKVNSIQELVALARAKSLRYGAGVPGNALHVAGEEFMTLTGVKLARIPYKGTGPMLVALLANEVHVLFATTGGAMPHIKEGRLTALGITSARPFAILPNVPTLASLGLKQFDIDTIGFILAPAKTPTAIIQLLNQHIVRIMRLPDVTEKLAVGGSEAVSGSPEELAAKLRADDVMMREKLKRMGLLKN